MLPLERSKTNQSAIDPKSSENSNWENQFRDSLKTSSQFIQFFNLDSKINTISYPSFLPISFAKKIFKLGVDSPLGKQFLPHCDEDHSSGVTDPIGDKKNAIGNGIIHRYESRILFTPTTVCPVLCRYCFRKNELSAKDEIFKKDLSFLENYLKENPKINEVILTGGDPLMLSNKKLEEVFKVCYESGIKYLRIHTRTPIILPKRIDQGLIEVFQKYEFKFSRIIFVLHTNHICELDFEVKESLLKLTKMKLDLKTQSVLLNGVNNSSEDLLALIKEIIEIGFTPYYLHHPDMAKGAMHFYLPIEEGRLIYSKLRDKLPGWAIPHYIVDHPGGKGKQFAFNPEKIEFSGFLLDKNGHLNSYNLPN